LNWTASKTALTELIYALYSHGVFHNGNTDIKLIAKAFEDAFNIDLGNFYHTFMELKAHWQSQNQTAVASEKGRSYIQQRERNKTILLFVRESKTDADGFTKGYVFVGPVNVEFTGSKSMSITWQRDKEMPHFLWQESAKLRVG